MKTLKTYLGVLLFQIKITPAAFKMIRSRKGTTMELVNFKNQFLRCTPRNVHLSLPYEGENKRKQESKNERKKIENA